MAVNKPNLLDGKAQNRVVKEIATKSNNAVKKPNFVENNTGLADYSIDAHNNVYAAPRDKPVIPMPVISTGQLFFNQ